MPAERTPNFKTAEAQTSQFPFAAKAVTRLTLHQSKAKKLVRKVVAPPAAPASPGSYSILRVAFRILDFEFPLQQMPQSRTR